MLRCTEPGRKSDKKMALVIFFFPKIKHLLQTHIKTNRKPLSSIAYFAVVEAQKSRINDQMNKKLN